MNDREVLNMPTDEELIKRLRICGAWDGSCVNCDLFDPEDDGKMEACNALLRQVAARMETLCEELEAANNACISKVRADLNAALERKHEEMQAMRRELEQATADMKQAAVCLCDVCKKYHPAAPEHSHYCGEIGTRPDWNCPIICGSFEWRGPQEETDPEAKP